MAGKWQRVTALGGRTSGLEIDSDDQFSLLMEMKRCPIASCQLNYLDRKPIRHCLIQYDGGSIRLDLITYAITHNHEETVLSQTRNDLIALMHQAVLMDTPNMHSLCSYQEGIETIQLIEAAESSVQEQNWIYR